MGGAEVGGAGVRNNDDGGILATERNGFVASPSRDNRIAGEVGK